MLRSSEPLSGHTRGNLAKKKSRRSGCLGCPTTARLRRPNPGFLLLVPLCLGVLVFGLAARLQAPHETSADPDRVGAHRGEEKSNTKTPRHEDTKERNRSGVLFEEAACSESLFVPVAERLRRR